MLVALGHTMPEAIGAAHSRYSVTGAVGLYPTSGPPTTTPTPTGSRWRARQGPRLHDRVGPQRESIPQSFHPRYRDMVPILEEVTVGLLAFCFAVATRVASSTG
jgi:hypothetical protein